MIDYCLWPAGLSWRRIARWKCSPSYSGPYEPETAVLVDDVPQNLLVKDPLTFGFRMELVDRGIFLVALCLGL